MPQYLCEIASMVSSNEARVRVTQIAWEELGSGVSGEVHADLFKNCLKIAGVERSSTEYSTSAMLSLRKALQAKVINDSILFGICLGLEIVAIENIETIFKSLAHNAALENKLAQTPFFKIHRVNEEGHIAHNIDNFIQYTKRESEREHFVVGFNVAVNFWRTFWQDVAEQMHLPQARA